MNLNEQQKAVVNAIDGTHVVIAGAGTGKTASMIERYLNMLTRGISSRDILNLTFTNAAATEAARRVGLLNAEQVFRTFHSFALELLKKERAHVPFQLAETVIPVRGEDYQLLFDLVKTYPAISSFRALQEKLSEWKRNNVEPEQAIAEAVGKEYYFALAYQDYERKCREQGWLDFDDCIIEACNLLKNNEEVRKRTQKLYLSVDEFQDTDEKQIEFLKLLYGGHIVVVGDENQCQPPGTLVDVLVSSVRGPIKAHVEQVPIEQLSETNDRLVSWDRHFKRVRLGIGRRFSRAVRLYDGNLLEIQTGRNKTKVTPNHFIWAKFNLGALKRKTHIVYLMWRKDRGFRVGTSSIRTACGSNQISHRGFQEKADKMWLLGLAKSTSEAHTLEEIYSLRYQIPESIFHKYNGCSKSEEQIRRIFKSVPQEGGFRLLKDRGLIFDHPLADWSQRKRKKHLTKFHGYFKTVAANLIEGVMELPTEETYNSAVIEKIRKVPYIGPVYSLEVEKDHTYIADGIPVGNCIYEWRSARPGSLSSFGAHFPGAQKLFLGHNYRSTRKLVAFFREILPVDNGLASHMICWIDGLSPEEQRQAFNEKKIDPSFTLTFEEWMQKLDGVDPVFIKYPDSDIEVRKVLEAAVLDPENTVIIARTNRQLFDVQRLAMDKGIKYKNLGKKDFWDQNEVKALLSLAKDVNQNQSASTALQEIINGHRLYDRYRHSGDLMNSDPIENLNNVVKTAARKGSVHEFLTYVRKLTYGRKSRKEKDLMLATVHQFKGREAKHVFVIGASQGKMPHKDGELQEEKRIFFVAASRAAETLQISWSGNRSMFLDNYANKVITYAPSGNLVEERIQEAV